MHSEEIKNLVKEKRGNGETFRQISRDLSISLSTIHSILNRKPSQYKKKTGPKPKLQKKDILSIKRCVNTLVQVGKRVTCSTIVKSTHIKVSNETVRRHLIRSNIKYKKCKQQIVLSKKHKRLRVETVLGWVRKNLDWSKVVFSDEKRFCLCGPDNWCSFLPENVIIRRDKRQNGGKGLMYWGMVFATGTVHLKEMIGRQNSLKYKELLSDFAVPTIESQYDEDYHFQQDNCSIHVSRAMMEFFDEEAISLVEWPARSPDLNLMEDVWSLLSDRIYNDVQCGTVEELRVKVAEALAYINNNKKDEIRKLFTTFCERIVKVIECDGEIINK